MQRKYDNQAKELNTQFEQTRAALTVSSNYSTMRVLCAACILPCHEHIILSSSHLIKVYLTCCIWECYVLTF
jgi:hypothetical protein